jgi:hypothetical protein
MSQLSYFYPGGLELSVNQDNTKTYDVNTLANQNKRVLPTY